MSIESANQIINEQDLTIEDLRHKVLDMTDERDLAIGKALNLLDSLKRIEDSGNLGTVLRIAKDAIKDYNAK